MECVGNALTELLYQQDQCKTHMLSAWLRQGVLYSACGGCLLTHWFWVCHFSLMLQSQQQKPKHMVIELLYRVNILKFKALIPKLF